ncbi:MAG TPA: hypothetical protein VFT49_03840 [Candidatus Saccharimonadales bacterium]|nr:hypothetical protein [Candidatus Saccharimonadales bacterium]
MSEEKRRTFAEENREEAQRILRLLEARRREAGLASPIGRIGLIRGAGVNYSEVQLRPPPPPAPPEESEPS